MLTFNFPSMTTEPIKLELNDFTPAPEYDADASCVPFKFGNALVMVSMIHPGVVNILSGFDEEEGEWNRVVRGTCSADTVEALAEYYYNNI